VKRRRRRLGYATVAILRAIDQGHRYGLDIVESTGLASGTVYVALGRLQKRGFLSATWERDEIAEREGRPRRRYYELTPTGDRELREALESFGALGLAEASGRSDRE
jgi:DNA-binding PadR family transcriptional regulator